MADLCSAVGENDIDKVADLLEAGADVNATNEQVDSGLGAINSV